MNCEICGEEVKVYESYSSGETRKSVDGLLYKNRGRNYPVHYGCLEALKTKIEEAEKFRGISRNENCPCGSGKKFKKCCLPIFERYV